MLGKAQHVKEFDGVLIDIGKNDFRPIFCRNVDYAEQDRYSDAVYDLGLREIDNEPPVAVIEPATAFVLDPLACQLVEIIAGKDLGHVGRGGRCSFCDHLNTAFSSI